MTTPPKNRIIHGDCIETMKKWPDGSIDLVFADPPFNIGYEYDVYHDALESDEYLQWCDRWLGQVARLLKPNGTFWLAIGDEYAAELKVLMQRNHHLACRSWVIWYYTFGVNCKRKFTRSHTHLFHMVKDPTDFTFNDEAIRIPSARQLVYGDKRANPTGRLPDDTWILDQPYLSKDLEPPREGTWTLRPQDLPAGFQPDDGVWYFPRVAGTFKQRAGWHGCQMPEQLLGRIIQVSSNEGEIVFDPFAGSGTTPAVAKKLGRNYLACELSKEYVRAVGERLKGIEPGDPLLGAADPKSSAPSTAEGRRLDQRHTNGPTRPKAGTRGKTRVKE